MECDGNAEFEVSRGSRNASLVYHHGWCKLHGRQTVRSASSFHGISPFKLFASNAFKARSKDKVTQACKGFFGRKKLEILGQRLAVGSRDAKLPLSNPNLQGVLPTMELAHARRVVPTIGCDNTLSNTDGPCNARASIKGRMRPKPEIRPSSKVIEALNESERGLESSCMLVSC
jgi:hypothetical protein